MSDFDRLSRTLLVRSAQVGRNMHATQRKATKIVARELIVGTPVDVGTARSNWQVGVAVAGLFAMTRIRARMAYAPGRKLGVGETRNAAAAIAAAYSVIDKAPTGADLYVSNPLKYINALDDGHSKQVPPGLVRRAVTAARLAVRRTRIFEDRRRDN